ncbi:MAG: hypothetical protein ACLQO6_10605 [Desulfomonilaceae bacterium]
MVYFLKELLGTIRHVGEGRTWYLLQEVMALDVIPSDAIILRFDVERSLNHHLAVAKHLAKAGIFSTMYFHTRFGCYDPRILKEISELGHEVGYHHECLDRCQGNFHKARNLFEHEINQFHRDGLNPVTVCSHGEGGLPKNGYKSNWELIQRNPNLLAENGLIGEFYLWKEKQSLLYASDTFKSYRQFWNTLRDARIIRKPLVILVHLHRWHDTFFVSSFEIGKDVVGYLKNRTLRERKYRIGY